MRLALAAAITLMLGAAGATAALHLHLVSGQRPESSSGLPSVPSAVRVSTAPPASAVPEVISERSTPSPRRHHPARSLTPSESYAAELELLQRAQADYASHDFLGALVLIAEHARQFPKGRLAEEREALRVRSLASAGRMNEARRAVATFATRFPRSVLLPRLQEAARTAE